MQDNIVPEFAIIGHPNEGKSAVVSTLAEDDSVRVSPYPGETLVCQTFPVTIDGKEIIRFTDTPGFQNPNRVLAWMKNYEGPDRRILREFIDTHGDNPDFKEDCELFSPVARGAGIIYIVDGSRPVRKVDLTEMEILRLTGRPRMAIINCKEDETGYLDQWKSEFRKHFNAIRIFNAHRATFAERIVLLENLKGIEQDWEPAIKTVISALKEDWRRRNALTAEIICDMVQACLTYRISQKITAKMDEHSLRNKLLEEYRAAIEKIEKAAHLKIRKNYKHNIFNYDLPAHSILKEDLFSEKTWQFLGLTPGQITAAAGMTGGAIGAALDIAAAGLLSQDSAEAGIAASRASFWTTYAHPFGNWGQALAGATFNWFPQAADSEQTSVLAGLRLYGGINALKAMVECQYENMGFERHDLLVNLGAEVMVWSGIWVDASAGVEWPDISQGTESHLVTDLGVRFTPGEKMELF